MKNDKTNKNNKNINLIQQDYDYLLKDEMWDLLSAYVDGELSVEESYLVIKQLDKDKTYQKAYEELIKLKKVLGSLTQINVNDSFDETLYRKINEMKNNEEESINNEEDEQWELVSAYVDGELSPEISYEVLKKINTISEYKKIYEEVIKVKNTLGSIEKREVSEDFDKKLFDKINKVKATEKNNVIQFDEFKEQQKKKESSPDFGKILRRVGMSLSAAAVIVIVFIFAIRYNLNNYQKEDSIEISDKTTDIDNLEEGLTTKYLPEVEEEGIYELSDNETNEEKRVLNDFAESDNNIETETIVKADLLDKSGEQIESTKPVILGPDEANAVYNMGNRVYMKNEAEKTQKKRKKYNIKINNTTYNDRDVSAILIINVMEDFNFDTNELSEIHNTNKELLNSKIIEEQSSDITNQIKIMSRAVSNQKE